MGAGLFAFKIQKVIDILKYLFESRSNWINSIGYNNDLINLFLKKYKVLEQKYQTFLCLDGVYKNLFDGVIRYR